MYIKLRLMYNTKHFIYPLTEVITELCLKLTKQALVKRLQLKNSHAIASDSNFLGDNYL